MSTISAIRAAITCHASKFAAYCTRCIPSKFLYTRSFPSLLSSFHQRFLAQRNPAEKHESTSKLSKGHAAERIAEAYLCAKGFKIIVRNWKIKYGEIDLIAQEKDELVFVEIKSRYVLPESKSPNYIFDNITPHKRKKLSNLANIYVERLTQRRTKSHCRHSIPRAPINYRIDLIGVTINKLDASIIRIEHIRNAI